jgi:hypothetical protein
LPLLERVGGGSMLYFLTQKLCLRFDEDQTTDYFFELFEQIPESVLLKADRMQGQHDHTH